MSGASRVTVRGRRTAIGLGVAIIVLGMGLFQAGRSGGQEPAAKAKAKAEAPKAEAPKAEAKAEAPKAAEPAPAQETTGALSLRYRFIEAYSVDENPARPELIGPYQVGSKETVNIEEERLQGAPVRRSYTIQVIYTERAAKVTKLGEVTDLVRRYDDFRAGGEKIVPDATPPLLKGLSIWCTFQKVGLPLIISLTDQRPLRQEEFSVIHDKLFLPQLSSVLPPGPIRVGDVWPIRARQSRSLLGNSVPDDGAGDFDVEGTLVDFKKAAEGNTWTARIEISGILTIGPDPAGVRAWIYFDFVPPPAVEPAATKPKSADKAGIFEARGRVARVIMTRRLTKPIDADGRLNYILTRELNLVRRPASNPFKLPEVPPVPKEANSWVRYDDPDNRFHFNHPQGLQLVSNERDDIEMRSANPKEQDVVYFHVQGEQMDPVRNRQLLDMDYHIRELRAIWQQKQQDVVEGESVLLPIPDAGAASKRSLHRFEAALKNGPRAPRAYCNRYLLKDPKGSIVLTAITERNDHLDFRGQVEELIKSFTFDQKIGAGVPPSRPAPGAAPAGPQDRPR